MAEIKLEVARQLKLSQAILDSYNFGRGLSYGYRIAIIGRANVGKSSLLNALLRRERAIVTEIPGTTRDTLTEWIEIAGFPILLTDTAGLRQSADAIETLGQRRTKDEIEKSDLIIFIIDHSAGVIDGDTQIYGTIEDKPNLIAINKIDLPKGSGLEFACCFPGSDPIYISAKTGDGLDRLRQRIVEHFGLESFSLDTALLATERQYQSMKNACGAMARVLDQLNTNSQPEVISVLLRETLDHLADLVGETTTDEILNDIFGKFCIGK